MVERVIAGGAGAVATVRVYPVRTFGIEGWRVHRTWIVVWGDGDRLAALIEEQHAKCTRIELGCKP